MISNVQTGVFIRTECQGGDLFKNAGYPNKVLCCPIDCEKQTHVALCCNGSGKVLKRAFPVKKLYEGVMGVFYRTIFLGLDSSER